MVINSWNLVTRYRFEDALMHCKSPFTALYSTILSNSNNNPNSASRLPMMSPFVGLFSKPLMSKPHIASILSAFHFFKPNERFKLFSSVCMLYCSVRILWPGSQSNRDTMSGMSEFSALNSLSIGKLIPFVSSLSPLCKPSCILQIWYWKEPFQYAKTSVLLMSTFVWCWTKTVPLNEIEENVETYIILRKCTASR